MARTHYDTLGLNQDCKPSDIRSAYRKLVRAGFSPSNVIRALKSIARNGDLLDSFEPPEETEPE